MSSFALLLMQYGFNPGSFLGVHNYHLAEGVSRAAVCTTLSTGTAAIFTLFLSYGRTHTWDLLAVRAAVWVCLMKRGMSHSFDVWRWGAGQGFEQGCKWECMSAHALVCAFVQRVGYFCANVKAEDPAAAAAAAAGGGKCQSNNHTYHICMWRQHTFACRGACTPEDAPVSSSSVCSRVQGRHMIA
eukprot:scaffold82677_cov20-Tisochrysis_lutea.AAC.1